MYKEVGKFFPIYEEAVSDIYVFYPIPPNILLHEENFILFFISVEVHIYHT
jgi:hypothetical protein